MIQRNVFHVLALVLTLLLVFVTLPAKPALAQSLTITPLMGTVGSTVSVSGTGVATDATVTVYFASGTSFAQVVQPLSTNVGTFSFNVPQVPAGLYTIVTSANSSKSGTFSVVPELSLSTMSARVGEEVFVSGTGFAANTAISLSFDGEVVGFTATDAYGTFYGVTFSVHEGYAGTRSITVNDGTHIVGSSLTIQPLITIVPTLGTAGDTIQVIGSGFRPLQPVILNYDQVALVTTPESLSTSSTGSFSAMFIAPTGVSRSAKISAFDGIYITTATFSQVSGIRLKPNTGIVGTSVTVSGDGFNPSRTVTLSFDDVQMGQTSTDSNGTFSATFNIPANSGGAHTIAANDGVYTRSATFNLIPSSISINPTSGYVDTNLAVTGSGFLGIVTVHYDDTTMVMVDANGVFSVTFSVPVSIHGNHTITISDGTTRLQTTFTMDLITPSVPILVTPASGSNQDSQPTFTWRRVSDPSEVTYAFQIATDASFTKIILEKDGLMATQYTLSKAERLSSTSKDITYFWRVKAVDRASNESAWSAPNSLYVSIFPDAAKFILIGIGVLIVAVLLLWWGRTTRRRRVD